MAMLCERAGPSVSQLSDICYTAASWLYIVIVLVSLCGIIGVEVDCSLIRKSWSVRQGGSFGKDDSELWGTSSSQDPGEKPPVSQITI